MELYKPVNKSYPYSSRRNKLVSPPLELFQMDLCRPIKVQSRRGKKNILVIVDHFSRYAWTIFLRYKDETFEVLVIFSKQIQVKFDSKIAGIRSDHGT